MAFFKKKGAPDPGADQDEVRGIASGSDNKKKSSAKSDAQAEKAKLKRIRAMKKKFDETVWETALETMKKSIPQFTIIDPDPDIPGGEIARYVLLGFDTKTVDDFANKADDDVGSIMTAIKHSMDVVVEDSLFDNELILVIPTAKSLAALAEFEETFDLKFFIVYTSEAHGFSLETKGDGDDDDDFIMVTLPEIRDMLKDSVPVKDLIHGLQVRVGSAGDYGGLTGEETTETRAGAAKPDGTGAPAGQGPDDDAIPEAEFNRDHGGDDGAEDPEGSAAPSPDEVKAAVAGGVSKAAPVAGKVGGQVEETRDAVPGAEPPAQQAPPAAPVQPVPAPVQPAPQAPAARQATGAQARIAEIRKAAQAASDQAKQDPEIVRRQQAMQAPQRQQFDVAAMDKYVTRTYYSDDLGLEVSSEPFDAMFLQSNPYIPFAETDGDGWLDGYVNNLRRDANARLAKLHYENLLLMRTRFLSIVTDHCAAITKSVATDDPKSRFGFTLAAIKKNKEDAIANLPAMSEAYKKQCEDAYEQGMRTAMENAANNARANYINQYYKKHEQELRQIETDLRNALESEFVAKVENLNDERRAEAKRQLDAGISEALKLCKDEYTKMIAMERQEYARLQAVIVDYMNEHMAADEARIVNDMEKLRRENTVAQVNSEATAALERARVDFEARLAEIRSENTRQAMDHENFVNELKDRQAHIIAEMQASHIQELGHKDEEIKLLNQQLEQADARMSEMTTRFINLDSEIEKKYATQLDMVQSERDAWDERAHHLERLHKYTDKIKLTGVIVGVIASLAVGIIIGCVIMAGAAQDAVDKQAENLANQKAQEDLVQSPEYHYFVNGEEIELDDGTGGQEGGSEDGQ